MWIIFIGTEDALKGLHPLAISLGLHFEFFNTNERKRQTQTHADSFHCLEGAGEK